MKKIYVIIILLVAVQVSFAQSTRLVLVEEFTGETCGPCAGANPGLNALLESKEGQVISLKYQNNIPSAGPNFYAYNTTDISNRTSFYANSYSPHAFIDGNAWNGNASAVTGALLNNRYAVLSPFDVIATHSFSPAYDIIYLHVVIRATQAVNVASHARIAIAERNVYGYTSPNGETSFEHVMRKMLPTGTGTVLPGTWAIGDSVVIDQQWTITVPGSPAIDMPLWPMLEVVAWVQNDATKEIMQTGHSPAVLTTDPALTSVTNVSSVTCAGSVTPDVEVTNNEPATITSLDIEYSLDGQTPSVYNWVGNIPQASSVVFSLPGSIPIVPGGHNIAINITNVNGAPDFITSNNNFTIPSGAPLPSSVTLTENFSSTLFPPADWLDEDQDFFTGWMRSTASAGSAKVDFYNSPPGEVDILYALTPADLSNATAGSFNFMVAHRQYSAAYSDRIDVVASTNCGQTWTSIWNKSGAALSTVAGFVTGAFTPTLAQFRAESIDLTTYLGQPDVLFAFKATSAYGNNAYIDDVNLSLTVGVAETNNAEAVSVYPMPSNGNVTMNVEKIKANDLLINVTGITGKTVKEISAVKSGNELSLDLTDLESGTYFLRITAGDQNIVKKIALEK